MPSAVLKLEILNYFKKNEINVTINILCDNIHRICEMVLRRISYRGNTLEMTLFQVHKISFKEGNIF